MFINFSEYPFPIKEIIFSDEDEDNLYYSIILKINENLKFNLIAVGDCCSTSYMRKYKDYDFNSIIGKTIIKIDQINFPDDYIFYETDDYSEKRFNNVISHHLYEISFKETEETFKMLLLNYSNGYYDGWLEINFIQE